MSAIEGHEWKTGLKPADIRILTDDELDSIAGGASLTMDGIAANPEWEDPARPFSSRTRYDVIP